MRPVLGIFVIFFVGNSYGRVESYREVAATSVLSRFVDAALIAYYEETRNVFLFARNPESMESLRPTIPLVKLNDWDALTEAMSEKPGTLVVFLYGDAEDEDSYSLMRLRDVSTKHPVLVVCNGAAECSSEIYFERIAGATDSPLQHYAFPDVEGAIRLFERTKVAEGSCGVSRLIRIPYDGSSVWPNDETFFMAVNFNKCIIRLASHSTARKSRRCNPGDLNLFCGIEGEIVRFIVEKLNATPVTTITEGPERIVKIKELVATNQVDLSYGHIFYYNNRTVQNSAWFKFLKGVVLIPHSASISGSSLSTITLPLEPEVWFGIAVTVFTILIVGKLIPQLRSISPLQQVSLILEISVPIQPRRTPQRVYFLSIVLFGFVISQSYLVHLTKIFSASIQHHIKTPEELEKSGIPIYGTLEGKTMLASFGHTRLVERFKILGNHEFWRAFDDIAESRVRAAIVIYLDVDGRAALTTFEDMESAFSWFSSTILTRNSSTISKAVNRILTAVSEEKISRTPSDFTLVSNATTVRGTSKWDNNQGPKKLSLKNLQGIFLLLVGGLTLGIVVFVFELALGFFKKKSDRTGSPLAWLGESLLPLRKTPSRSRKDAVPDSSGIGWFDRFAATRAIRRRI